MEFNNVEGMKDDGEDVKSITQELEQKKKKLCKDYEATEQFIHDIAVKCKESNYFDALKEVVRDIFSTPQSMSNYFCVQGDNGPVNIVHVRRVYSILSDNGDCSVDEELFNASTKLIEKLRSKQASNDEQSLMAQLILLFENPQLQSPEYYEDVMPSICQLTATLSLTTKAMLVRFWSRYNVAQLQQLVISLQQYLTCSVVQLSDASGCNLKTLDSTISNALEILDILFTANILNATIDGNKLPIQENTDQTATGAREEVTDGASATSSNSLSSNNSGSDNAVNMLRRFGILQRERSVKRVHELQTLLSVNPASCRSPIIPFNAFYNEALSDAVDYRYDYKRFREREKCILNYPCVVMPYNKTEMLNLDNKMKQSDEVRSSLIMGIFSGNLPNPYFVLRVRRDRVIEDALLQLEIACEEDANHLLKQLKVQFIGEEGVDDGGVSKEFFLLVTQQIFNPQYAMFKYNETAGTYWFVPNSFESDAQYKLIGLLVGLAIYNGIMLDVAFPMILYRKLYGQETNVEDLQDSFPEIYQSLKNILNYQGDVESDFMCTFRVSYTSVFGETIFADLIEGGESTFVNNDNRQDFAKRYTEFLLTTSVKDQYGAFQKGFNVVTEDSLLKYLFRPDEIDMLVCGSKEKTLDFRELEKVAAYDGGLTKDSQLVRNFWDVVQSFDEETKRKFLKFATGSDRIPVGGLSKMKFTIIKNGGDSDRLPTSHTCFNILLLCDYSSKEKLKNRLMYAINNGTTGFGLF